MAILWYNDSHAAERYTMAVGEAIHQVESGVMASRLLSADHSERLVVIGPDVDLEQSCDLSETTRVDRPEVGIIMLRRRLDVSVLAQALRSGVREVVPADDLTAIAEACRHSRDLSLRLSGAAGQPGAREGRIVTIFSAKGGVGKTTLATNVSAQLAATGSRTLLVDLDLAFGDVAISLQLVPKTTMTDVVAMSGHLDEQGLASVVTRHPASSLDAVCAPAEPGEADRVLGPTVAEVLRVGKRAYDFVIVDTPPAFNEHVLAAFDISDQIVLLATLDIPALKNLRLTLDTLDLLGAHRVAGGGPQPLRREGRAAAGRCRDLDQAEHRRHGPEQRRRSRLREPRGRYRSRRPQAPGERGSATARRRVHSSSGRAEGAPRDARNLPRPE